MERCGHTWLGDTLEWAHERTPRRAENMPQDKDHACYISRSKSNEIVSGLDRFSVTDMKDTTK